MAAASLSAQTKTITEDDLLRWDAQGFRMEVIEGRAVPYGGGGGSMSAVGVMHAEVITNIYDLLKPFVRAHGLGKVYPEGLHFILETDTEGVRGSRIPDVCFIRKDRFPPGFDPARPFPGAPDLAVEVISPTETQQEVAGKVRAYLAAGPQEVWVVYPALKEVYQYRQSDPRTIQVYRDDDRLDTEALFPGLTIIVSTFFLMEGFT